MDRSLRRASGLPEEFSWAGIVIDQDIHTPVDYTLRNRQLAAVAGKQYRVCFSVKSFPGGLQGEGLMQLGNGAAHQPPDMPSPQLSEVYIEFPFEVLPTWTEYCSDAFEPIGSDNLIKFGHIQGSPEYLVDWVRLVQQ
ncbi:MAG: hypothetical protein HC923_03170 [Myxococcales bacterium]|nr:hypothetical protein [Myxococcales bacterium]